jgi:hypothetical protein
MTRVPVDAGDFVSCSSSIPITCETARRPRRIPSGPLPPLAAHQSSRTWMAQQAFRDQYSVRLTLAIVSDARIVPGAYRIVKLSEQSRIIRPAACVWHTSSNYWCRSRADQRWLTNQSAAVSDNCESVLPQPSRQFSMSRTVAACCPGAAPPKPEPRATPAYDGDKCNNESFRNHQNRSSTGD